MAVMAPAAAARVVVTAMMAMEVSPTVVEPGLKPYQPNQSRKTPRAARGNIMPGNRLDLAGLVVFA